MADRQHMPTRLLDNHAVAALLAITIDQWLRVRDALMDAHGFPRPVPGLADGRRAAGAPHRLGRSARWDRVAIDRWLEVQMPASLRAAASDGMLDAARAGDALEAQRARMDANAEEIAHG
jgi:hypothetical protein